MVKKQVKKKRMNPFISLFIIVLFAVGISMFFEGGKTEEISLNEAISRFNSGAYTEVIIKDQTFIGKGGRNIKVNNKVVEVSDTLQLPTSDSLKDLGFNITPDGTKVTIADTRTAHLIADLLPTIAMILLFIVLFVVLFGKVAGGGGGPMAFVKNKAKKYDLSKKPVKFGDVAGAEEEKEDLQEFVDFLKNPKKYHKLGAKIPRGVLMAGPPGTGKTLIARAVAGEAGVPFFSISGSEFVEMFVGVGAARVRDLFKEAREKAPAIIFIDEIDAIGKKRAPGVSGGNDEREQTLNQILTEMDGFEKDAKVIVMAATNRIDVLDKALLRPGRFDRKVFINLPNLEDRMQILKIHAKGKPISPSVKWDKIASSTTGFSGADLENLLNEAAILTGRKNQKTITPKIIQEALEKQVIGNTKKSQKRTDTDKKLVAYHEVGHAIVGHMLPHPDPVHKISMISRGRTGGVTWFLPEKDTFLTSKAKFIDDIAVSYGGRIAEEIFFGKENITTGASNDIERATQVARSMVMQYGMDDELGAENYVVDEFAPGGYKISDATLDLIDKKVRTILDAAQQKARDIITKHKDLHTKITEELLKTEEMDRETFEAFFEGVKGVPEKIKG